MKAALLLALATPAALAFDSLSIGYGDWTLACDNTGRCIAAGYQADNAASPPVSLAFFRDAGADAEPGVALQALDKHGNPPPELTLLLDDAPLATLKNDSELPPAARDALLERLRRLPLPAIRIRDAQDNHWQLSTQGLRPTLMQMDAHQRRTNHQSALVNPGAGDAPIPAAEPLPHIRRTIPQGEPRTLAPGSADQQKLAALIQRDTPAPCRAPLAQYPITLHPLGDDRHLGEIESCLLGGGYQPINHYFITDSALATLIPDVLDPSIPFNDYASGILTANERERATADCWQERQYAYDGQRFVKSADTVHGLCRGFTGGAWEMPLYRSDLHPPAQ
ncbi:MAG: DUF1176 domain-containing protein [Cardiobacteriaceae bacterium]|nr:DUF1176 domain-containing protein [Cardiobacteriaceae bacterium]